jgi:hypothetical protein
MWWGAGLELLLTRTKNNARVPQAQREGHIRATGDPFMLL